MPFIGAHVSAAGGIQNSVENALAIGANAFAVFTRNPRSWVSPPLNGDDAESFKRALAASGISADHVLPHDSYLINMASPKEDIAEKSYYAFLDEVHKVEQLGLLLLNFHPGSPGKDNPKEGIHRIADFMKRILSETTAVKLIVESTAGQGNHLGATFEELAEILELTAQPERTGVCLDTCHMFAAGYDIRTRESYAKTMRRYDELLGRESLKAMHLNDSMKGLGMRVDRHASLGEGMIGIEAFQAIMEDKAMHTIPLILETPQPDIWSKEIAMLREFAKA
jgi:deoxyribonuclease-4